MKQRRSVPLPAFNPKSPEPAKTSKTRPLPLDAAALKQVVGGSTPVKGW